MRPTALTNKLRHRRERHAPYPATGPLRPWMHVARKGTLWSFFSFAVFLRCRSGFLCTWVMPPTGQVPSILFLQVGSCLMQVPSVERFMVRRGKCSCDPCLAPPSPGRFPMRVTQATIVPLTKCAGASKNWRWRERTLAGQSATNVGHRQFTKRYRLGCSERARCDSMALNSTPHGIKTRDCRPWRDRPERHRSIASLSHNTTVLLRGQRLGRGKDGRHRWPTEEFASSYAYGLERLRSTQGQ